MTLEDMETYNHIEILDTEIDTAELKEPLLLEEHTSSHRLKVTNCLYWSLSLALSAACAILLYYLFIMKNSSSY